MQLVTSILDRLENSPDYVCEFCGLSYDEQRRNCHACGFDVIANDAR